MPTKLYDENWMQATFAKMAQQILQLTPTALFSATSSTIGLIGVRTRGAEMADRIAGELKKLKVNAQVGYLDPTMFRDDLQTGAGLKNIMPTEISFDLNNLHIILIDDVLLTGRSIRAAIDALFHYGRPATIRLCVMVDRGGRELPIQPDICGARIDVPVGGWVRVKLAQTDNRADAVYVVGAGDEEP